MSDITVYDTKDATTLSEFIEAGSAVMISYSNMSFKEKIKDIVFPVFNVLDDYMYELRIKAKDVILDETQYFRYVYKPKLLAIDIYGNTELYFIILALNNICNVKEFDMRTIKLLNIADMEECISAMFNAEKKDIKIYNTSKR